MYIRLQSLKTLSRRLPAAEGSPERLAPFTLSLKCYLTKPPKARSQTLEGNRSPLRRQQRRQAFDAGF